MNEGSYNIGEGPATRVSLSLPEGTAMAMHERVGKRELRGEILDEYLADYERRKGPISAEEQERARRLFDEVFTEESTWPTARPRPRNGRIWPRPPSAAHADQ
ncbi:hypothetical protein ABZ897_59485 [Nonomuraea sp. NPDC046802]|uniref:hypothetical protein n=1 Tax=Nonomuraea sp. NPDC046802 TaxID=3154919 RepID=UPI0034083EF4